MMSESSSEGGRSRSSSASWEVLDNNAFEIFELPQSMEISDEEVMQRYEEALRERLETNESTTAIEEAAETLRTETRRQAYLEALQPPTMSGITDMLMNTDAPYGRLLAATLKLQGRFNLQLPKIVVCGMQSEGKSSLLERIAMREMFPRDVNFCTRMPVRLMFRNSKHQNMVIIRFKNTRTNQIVQEVETHTENNQETYSREIATMIAAFIKEQHPDDQGDNVDTEHEIQVEIRTPSVPTLDLIDLPGIVSYPENVHQATIELTERMIRQEQALVLLVASAQARSLRNNRVFPILRRANKPIVLVLTFLDHLQGQRPLLLKRLSGQGDLPSGIEFSRVVPVVNRDSEENDENDEIELLESITREREILHDVLGSGSPDGVQFDESVHGITGVLHSLNDMLLDYMRTTWAASEENRAYTELQKLLSKLWGLGIRPSLLDANKVAAEIWNGYHRFLKLPSNDFKEAGDTIEIKTEIPACATLIERQKLRYLLVSDVSENAEAYVRAVWEQFANLVVREVFESSPLPIRLDRIPKLIQGARDVLNRTLTACLGDIKNDVISTTRAVVKSALSKMDEDDIDVGDLLCQIKRNVVTAVLYFTLGRSEFLDNMDSWIVTFLSTQTFTETEEAETEREGLEASIEAAYGALHALAEISGQDTDGLLFQRTRVFLDAGPTHELIDATRNLARNDELWSVAPDDYLIFNLDKLDIPESRNEDSDFQTRLLKAQSCSAQSPVFEIPRKPLPPKRKAEPLVTVEAPEAKNAFEEPLSSAAALMPILGSDTASDSPMDAEAQYSRSFTAKLHFQDHARLRLPEIVVCGMGSEGKSSLLQRLTMRNVFPYNAKFCTRVPVRLMLRTRDCTRTTTVRLKNTTRNEILSEEEEDIESSEALFSEKIARMIQNVVAQSHPEDQGDNVDIDHEIQVEISGPSTPTIDIVDLPGIIQYPDEARSATRELTRRMVNQDHAIVIAAVSATIPALRNSEIFGLLRESQKRVVLALTMADQKGVRESTLLGRLNGSGDLPEGINFAKVVPVVNCVESVEAVHNPMSLLSIDEENAILQDRLKHVPLDSEAHGISGILHSLHDILLEYTQS
mmetsp:Transcript_19076/g.33935  ORF Transcript_19076/g.33935 Transcript_19076/m.33935 type:complete len:1089 (-) Transcript_19076:138-3404(-)